MPYLVFLMLLCTAGTGAAQVLYPYRTCTSPKALTEFSGLAYLGGQTLAAINDGGNAPALYFMDTTGKLLRTRTFTGITNTDWEELFAGNHCLYIADVGDNRCQRKTLVLYCYDLQKDTIVSRTAFGFAEKNKQPLSEKNKHYDCEAGFYRNGQVYLFTKTHANPYTGKSLQYRIQPGAKKKDYTAVDSAFFGTKGFIQNSLTGAALSPSGELAAFISCTRLWVHYRPQEGHYLGSGWEMAFTFDGLTQKEAVTFLSDYRLVVADEKTAGLMGGRMYFFDLRPFFSGKSRYALPFVKNASLRRQKDQSYRLSFETTGSQAGLTVVWAGADGKMLGAQNIALTGKKITMSLRPTFREKQVPAAFWLVQDNQIIFTSRITEP